MFDLITAAESDREGEDWKRKSREQREVEKRKEREQRLRSRKRARQQQMAAVRVELDGMSMIALRRRARQVGVDNDALISATERSAIVDLITRAARLASAERRVTVGSNLSPLFATFRLATIALGDNPAGEEMQPGF
jgi:hypothetical protein